MPPESETQRNRWSLLPRLRFQSRSPERDSQTDARRRSAILDVVQRQRGEAEGELAGLTRRMNEALANAAIMLESTAEYGQRDPEEESAIAAFERSAAAARLRIEQLKGEIAFFDQLLSQQGLRS
jgi:hypothetical protein